MSYDKYKIQELNLSLHKFDELDSLLQGLQYIELNNPTECYYWANPTLEAKCEKVNYDFSKPYPFLVGFYSDATLTVCFASLHKSENLDLDF